MPSDFMSASDCERFLACLDIGSEEDCWYWRRQGAARYGSFDLGGKKQKAHRLAYRWQFGDIPPGENICHHCDHPYCCNPLHLFTGSQKRNMEDCARKGRIVSPRGTAHYRARVTEEQVLEIRRLRRQGWTLQRLADKFGIANQTVSTIVLRQFWAWLPDPVEETGPPDEEHSS